VVAHDEVAGFMPAMTMSFEIRGATPFVREGDRIAATLVVAGESAWIEDVRVTSTAEGLDGERTGAASYAAPGVLVPALTLRNQDDQVITLRSFGGRVLVLTFIYTRCPLAEACPLMMSHLERVRRTANDAGLSGRVAFLAITLDPETDTPSVLRTYGEARLDGADRFAQWTLATGTTAEVAAVADVFGVGYEADGGLVTHSMATAVVGHDGRVVRVFPSNSWSPDEMYTLVERETQQIVAR
jgi:protein SCO1/2